MKETIRAISAKRLLLLYQCAAMFWKGQRRRSHCDSLQGLNPLLPWMTCLPPYLAGREVFGGRGGWGRWEEEEGGGGCTPQGGWDVTEITRENGAGVSLQSRSCKVSD